MPHIDEDISWPPKYVLGKTIAQELRIVHLIAPITNMDLLMVDSQGNDLGFVAFHKILDLAHKF